MHAENILGSRVVGTYLGHSIAGTATHIEPNWEPGSRGAVNLLVTLDEPVIVTPGCPARDLVFLLGLNLKTGSHYRNSGKFSVELSK